MARIRFQYKRTADQAPTARIQCNMFLDFEQLINVLYQCHEAETIDLFDKILRRNLEDTVRAWLTDTGMEGTTVTVTNPTVHDKAREICQSYWAEYEVTGKAL